jgi:hypothetical protein
MNTKGFSIIIAMGTIGVLLIIVVGLASTYLRELRLTRTSYDDIVAYASAEGMFEYGMLKVRNHREGFQDQVSTTDVDGKENFILTTDRSRWVKTEYSLLARSTGSTFPVLPNTHLILPFFVSADIYISGKSQDPTFSTWTKKTTGITVAGISGRSWVIVWMSGSVSIGLSGTGDIAVDMSGILREQWEECYWIDGNEVPCDGSEAESIPYFYDTSMKVSDFITSVSDPYFLLYNDTPSSLQVTVQSQTPYSLPTLDIEARATKNQSSQVFRFRDDRGRYYDALKYGVGGI